MKSAATHLLDRLRGRTQSRSDLRHQGRALLRRALNDPAAEFREQQWDAIERLIYGHERLLVVQRTGWGKSLVYFLTACMLRDEGAGPTLVISPLLSLMRNQVLAAERLGVRAATINSSNQNEWASIYGQLRQNKLDVLLVAPERLASKSFRDHIFMPMSRRIGCLVVDEAHCISDWGHDFRPDYRRIRDLLEVLPRRTPVLATTATANDRVVKDVVEVLGPKIRVLRGPLARDTLSLQVIDMPLQVDRLAWLAEHLPLLAGSGIVYCLTVRDAQRVAAWLQTQSIDAEAYSSRLEKEQREDLERRLLANQVKVLVATIALGMGFDKPDIGFVIHYQRPASAVHYYQQVGRAGRAVNTAYGVLLGSEEDDAISTYFIQNAFPPREHVEKVLAALEEESPGGLSMTMLAACVNLQEKQLEKIIKILAVERPSPITWNGGRWHRTGVRYRRDEDRVRSMTQMRLKEQRRMHEYSTARSCLMAFLLRELDDPEAAACGRCSACRGEPVLAESFTTSLADAAGDFIRGNDQIVVSHRRWPPRALKRHGWSGPIPEVLRHETGRAVSIYGDDGWGKLVSRGKHEVGHFDDGLVWAAADLVQQRWCPSPPPTWVTFVPSLNQPDLVRSFAVRLAEKLGLTFRTTVYKVKITEPQKAMENEFQQAHNLELAFNINSWDGMSGCVLLVDDIVDSGWTFAVVSALLREAGSGPVFPLALAVVRRMGAI
jgi:ATP-dependent DNA helicase RecQ